MLSARDEHDAHGSSFFIQLDAIKSANHIYSIDIRK